MERLLDLGGKVVTTYRPDTDWTYDKNGVRIGTDYAVRFVFLAPLGEKGTEG